MKKTLLAFLMMHSALSFANAAEPNKSNGQGMVKLTVTTDENGDIASVVSSDKQYDPSAWHIRDLSGYTNIRNAPNGKVCMRLKANTQYDIYTDRESKGWLRMVSCYNLREGYWIRFHDSSTGTYWIAKSVLY